MNKKEMIEMLEKRKEEIEKEMGDVSLNFCADYNLQTLLFFCDLFNEYADSQVDIYTSDLFAWAEYNYKYIEKAVDEFGMDRRNFDFLKLLQSGQFLYNEKQLFEDIEKIVELMGVNYLLENDEEIKKELEENEIDEMFAEITSQVDSYSRCKKVVDIINKYIKEEKKKG